MKVVIGGRERIASFSMSIPMNEDAWVEFQAGDWAMRVKIVLEDAEHQGEVASMRIDGKDDYALLTLVNWKNHLPVTFKPFLIAKHTLGDIVLLAWGHTIGDATLVNLDFVWEKSRV